MEYTHVLFVYKIDPEHPDMPNRIMAVAAEVNNTGYQEGGSHFLGVFAGGHRNLGSSDEWGDLETFTKKALELVAERFKETPRLIVKQP